MNRTKSGLRFLTLTLSLCFAPAIQADILTVDLTSSDQSGIPGTTVAFFGNIMNPSATDTIYLNGDFSFTSTPLLTVDDGPFNMDAPLFLDPVTSSGLIELFDVIIDPGATATTFMNNSFSITGGPDGGTGSDFDDLVDVSFSVTVEAPLVSTPEPSAFSLLFTLLVTSGAFRRFSGNRTRSRRLMRIKTRQEA